MDIVCIRCRKPIPATDVDVASRLAKCGGCNAVFDFAPQVNQGYGAPIGARPPVPIPDGITILEGDDDAPDVGSYRRAPEARPKLVIARQWRTRTLAYRIIMCVVWDVGVGYMFRASGGFGDAPLFLLPFLLAGVALTYATIAALVNRTLVVADDESLRIEHGPLPWFGNRVLPVTDLEQLFCKQIISTDSDSRTQTATYTLAAVLATGRQIDLLCSLPRAEQAVFFEQRLEDRLGIVNVPVGGEYVGVR